MVVCCVRVFGVCCLWIWVRPEFRNQFLDGYASSAEDAALSMSHALGMTRVSTTGQVKIC